MSILSENLRKAMFDKRVNGAQLARLSGVPQSNISQYLNNHPKGQNPTLNNILALAKALDIHPAVLLFGYDPPQDLKIPKEVEKIVDAYMKLKDDDPRKEAIDTLLLKPFTSTE